MKTANAIPNVLGQDEQIGKQNTVHVSARTLTKSYPLHSHQFYEIEFVVSGQGRHLFNGECKPIGKGTVYLLTPEDVHAVIPDEPLRFYNAMFSEALFPDKTAYETLIGSCGMQTELVVADSERIINLFSCLLAESARETDEYHASFMSAVLQSILITVLRAGQDTGSLPVPGNPLRDIFSYLHRHFREQVTLNEITARAGFSPNYFCHLFRVTTGKCFTEYLTELRLRYACHLTLCDDMPITDICYQSGFSSFATFSREFLKQYHSSPSVLRKQNHSVKPIS